ncbi:MAG: threonine ammonia-lyase [Bdellovibrionaceae bacterium]|nr:threonine ammonia-lyase [Pseudobdellovibrionaceae bacterium]|tara:strand:- start:4945 stop:6171 length:1227 start_codon:yes stop_codon:yes gene_type:complete
MKKFNSDSVVTYKDIEEAYQFIKPHVLQTQLSYSGNTSQWLGTEVFLKHENEQRTGSFKVRGALNKVGHLDPDEKARGIIASSAGNHAQGVAFSAHQVNVPATIVMPKHSPLIKAKATQHYGATVIHHGDVYDQAYEFARQLEKEKGYTFVHPFNDPWVIAGQGTVGIEILQQVKDLDSIVVSVGGGGLIAGLATMVKHINPKIKVYGVVAAKAPNMLGKFKGEPEKYPFISGDTIADGIAVREANDFICDNYIKPLVDDIVQVNDDEMCESLVWLMERSKTVVEACSAAVLAGAHKANWDLGKKTCLILSGGNIDLNLVAQIIERGLMRNGRLSRIRVKVSDRPGQLHLLTKVFSDLNANVLEVHHDRHGENIEPKQAIMEFVIESRDHDHLKEIKSAIKATGAHLI